MGKRDEHYENEHYVRFADQHPGLDAMLTEKTALLQPGALVKARHPYLGGKVPAMVVERNDSLRVVEVVFLADRTNTRAKVDDVKRLFPIEIDSKVLIRSVIDLSLDLASGQGPIYLLRPQSFWKIGSAYSLLMSYHEDDGVI